MKKEERCSKCDALTGHAGIGDDSLTINGINPLCEECFDKLTKQRNRFLESIRLIRSVVYRCGRCRTWYLRYPLFLCELDKGDECEKCGCSSFSEEEGRPYGSHSSSWTYFMSEIEKSLNLDIHFTEEEMEEFFVFKLKGDPR